MLPVFLLLTALVPSAAAADPQVRISGRADSGAFRRGPLQARVGERVELRVELVGRRGRRALPPGARVRWLRVTPHMQHETTPPPNEGVAQYSNSVLFGPRHGSWIGLDAVEYESVPLGFDGDRLELDAARAPGEPLGRFGGAGSMWVAAEVELPDGRVARTPGAADVDRLGLRSNVMRVSFRTSDDFLGWLGTYFHVPNIFGSVGPQADRYVGADCADVLVGAQRASGRRGMRYTSVAGIGRYARAVSDELFISGGTVRDADGAPVELRWGVDVRPGDLLAIDYVRAGSRMPRAWDHIGALVGDRSDRGAAGVFDGSDLLRHMTPRGLFDLPVAEEGRIRFRIWRWRNGSGPRNRT